MRLLYIVSRFPNTTTTFIANEMSALADLGADIHIAAVWSSVDATPHTVEVLFLPRVIRLSLSNPALWIGALGGIIRRPAVIGVIVRLIAGHTVSVWAILKVLSHIPKGLYVGEWAIRHGIEHIHAHFLTAPAAVALIASVVCGVPYTVTVHAFDIFSTDPRKVNGAVRLKSERAAVLILISQYNKRFMLDRWRGLRARLEVVYNGIDFALFSPPAVRRPLPRDAVILTNGSLLPKKGHDVLIRVVGKLRADGFPVTLNIVGGGELLPNLKALVTDLHLTDAVIFLGTMTQTELVRYYHSADVFALACRVAPDGDMDGIPTVLIEALAVELPTVSTQVSGVPEIIIDGQTGRCVAPEDVNAFAEAIRTLIKQPDTARAMGQRGRVHAMANFDRRVNVRQLAALWHMETDR